MPTLGYVTKGTIHVRYTDGTVEVMDSGTAFYLPAGHTAWAEQDSAFLDFSPEEELKPVLEHVARKTIGIAARYCGAIALASRCHLGA
jgi:hypothetical protein